MDYAKEKSGIERRKRIAEMLMQQSAVPLETNQTAGGYVVPVSPLSAVSKIAQQLAGSYIAKKADERGAQLEQDQLKGISGIDFSAPDAPAKLAAMGMGKEAIALAMQRAKGGRGANPYFTPVETSAGLFKFDARTGEIKPLMEGENRLMRSSSDPNQQAQIMAAKEGQKIHKYTDPNYREGFARGQDLIGGPSSHPMVTIPSVNGQSQFTGDPSTLNPQERAFFESQGLIMPRQQSTQGQLEPSPAIPRQNPFMGPSMQEKSALKMQEEQQKADISRESDIEKKKIEMVNAPLPTPALKLAQEYRDDIGIASSIKADLAGIVQLMESGQLNLGPIDNAFNELKLLANSDDQEASNYGSFKATLEKIRNDSLRLNKGVQTEGDSVRAFNEIAKNLNNKKFIMQRLNEIQKINERGAELKANLLLDIYKNYGKEAPSIEAFKNQPAAIGGKNDIDDLVNQYLPK